MTNQKKRRDRWRDLRWGIKWGVLIAVIYYPAALAKHALTQRWGDYGLFFLARAYVLALIAGGVAGAGVGLLRPLLAWGKLGAALIGVLIAIPVLVFLVVDVFDPGAAELLPAAALVLAFSILGGGPVGLGFYLIFRQDS